MNHFVYQNRAFAIHEIDIQSDGVISLEQLANDFGSERRRMRVVKMRGLQYHGGYHDFTIEKGGLEIYPRLVAAARPGPASSSLASPAILAVGPRRSARFPSS